MKIVHVSSTDGAASYRLHTGLRRIGIDSTMFIVRKRRDDPTLVAFKPSARFADRLRRRLRERRITRAFARYRQARVFELFTDDRSPFGSEPLTQLPSGDLYHVHTLFGVTGYQAFFPEVPRRAPVVRTLHDINFFSGGCHQDAGCGRFAVGCGVCPQLNSGNEHDLSREIWRRKRSALQRVDPARLHIAATSEWIASEARRSPLLRPFPLTVIPNGVDTDVFRPRNRHTVRSALSLPPDARVLLFVADPITRVNKGFTQLAKALDGLNVSDALLLSVGRGRPPATAPIPHQHFGLIQDERLLALLYNAADVFVLPSMQDNCPQTAIEAIASGTPVVGYATCGVPEIVRPGLTGLLVPPQDIAALRLAIRTVLEDQAERARLSVSCREVAVQDYTLERLAQRYAALYRTALAVSGGASAPERVAVTLGPA
jgi:glycosyltransferase involved in cell wall biosynthesis